jgi:nucleotide-binding universal stress UspA family protein
VLHKARVPTFIVRQKQHEIIDVKSPDVLPHVERILCAIEMNDLDRTVLNHAVAVAERFNGKLTVLYSDESKGDKNHLRVKETLCDWVAGAAKAKCEPEPIVRKGGAADQIITYAEEEKSDLIVIGARHKAFHDSMVLGRTTDLVIRHAPAPVLVVPGLQ